MKHTLFVLLGVFSLLIASCKKEADSAVERVSIPAEIVTPDLISSMPGTLLVYDKELVWMDAVMEQNIHVIDRATGMEKHLLSLRGEAPEEVTTPQIVWAPDRQLAVYDRNGAKQLFVSLDSLDNKKKTVKETVALDSRFRGVSNLLLANGQTLFVSTDSITPFHLLSEEGTVSFGTYPLKEVEIDNGFEVYQGVEAYNPFTGKLVQSFDQWSYLALYHWQDGSFVKDKEVTLSEVDYTLSGHHVTINSTPRYAPSAIAITKDYIVSIDRDKKASPVETSTSDDGRRRPFAKAPRHVFVYDYDFNLLKIIDVGMPVFRIAADCASNQVYLIGVNPDFCIGTIEIP